MFEVNYELKAKKICYVRGVKNIECEIDHISGFLN
jgi:hypothetical protein